MSAPKPDHVNHPPHYKSAAGIEVIDVIEAFELNFRLGNTTKYILRAGRKGNAQHRTEDLKKGRWYLDREIAEQETAASADASETPITELDISSLIAAELRERHCCSPDGTFVSASTEAVVRSVLAALTDGGTA